MPSSSLKLDSLLEPANRGDWNAVLDGLLVAWRATPHTALANPIVAVGNKLAGDLHPPKDWDALAKKPDAANLTTLLAALLDKGSVKGRGRLETLAGWPEDPRIDRWVASRFVDPPFTSSGARPFWTRLAPLARRIRDAQAASAMLKARAGYDKQEDFEEFLAGHVDRIRVQLKAAKDAELPADAVKVLAQLDTALQDAATPKPRNAADAETLLAQVLAKPEDEEARAVLADVLLEQGHPRGELIALQLEATRRTLTATERKRERELLKSARKELLGPLDAVLKPDCVFTRGFLSHAALKQGSARAIRSAIQKTAGHPLWATVEHLEGRGDYDITTHPVMKSLRSLANSEVMTQVLAKMPWLESLAMRGALDQWTELGQDPSAFLALRHLDIFLFLGWVSDFLATPLVSRLERLQVRIYVSAQVSSTELEFLSHVPTLKVPDITFRLVRNDTKDWSCGFRFVREPDGRHAVHLFTTAMNEPHEQLVRDDLLAGLEQVARLKRSKLTLAHRLRSDVKADVERRVKALGGTLEA
ncbi:TIGR02996 domain-containing protein [Myxococcus qinghaiensis]|uniref:TIGR02996 domain-containing protein n=1 Tax=Myxococcus qinghaiensis TaxID=2906758 RepID=UPI0020A7E6A1|nr:TIGR02996 domain-containing protein [Myxococcus qinghaiensis]MCP3168399.1 TIGR02996 domain-containing protein [Myxococcus qinghaiensis]